MKALRSALIALAACFLVLGPGALGYRQTSEGDLLRKKNRAILRKLNAVTLSFMVPTKFAEFEHRAKNSVELKLRQAGLKVYSEQLQDVPVLEFYVAVDFTNHSESKPTGTLEVWMREMVKIVRNGEPLWPETWRYHFLDSSVTPEFPVERSQPKTEDELVGLADSVATEFVNDYLAANPKKQ